MRLAGLLLLPAGWGIVISAVVLFPHPAERSGFAIAGLCIQAGGLVLSFLASKSPQEKVE